MKSIALLGALLFGLVPSQTAPDVFARGHITEKMRRVVTWQLAHPQHGPTDWTNGAFYAGVFAAYQTTKDAKILAALMDMGEANGWKPGARFDHADDLAITQTYVDLYRLKKDRRMIQPTIDQIERLRREPGPEIKAHGITWWWCDALFMGPPALAKIGATLKDPSYAELSDKLFQETYARLFNHEEHLFARDDTYLWNDAGEGKREANGRKVFWSRGNGWVAGGLARLLDELPKNHPKRAFYLGLYRELMARIITLQQPDGLWRSSLLDPDAYPGGEGSGSGFYCYALAWGLNRGVLDRDTYRPAMRRAWAGLNTLVTADGMVGWVQPIGADPRRNFSPESWEVYGAGAFLLAGSEVIKAR